ncbi:unnamed protein product (macronuclear) [Paramecium tetraurelia]|uniref:Cyclic nucleotide-binding domain-containing protein n=1 Tax=Paramecium tetraurelia TaxID=5888 RepID=A0BZN4_PARTE|nr:uncharacterized protein GSPATT00005853001 [Paramecium tetraurelia]CAK64001.1 unnamed protein product [Paramecium tetraurelia]|eukprot:XP_001431399.1 hypothetical protein (macronuclear) [Paramecium tetraurelia strain d4-2]
MNSELGSFTERAPLKTQPSIPKQPQRPAFLKTVNLKTLQNHNIVSFQNKIWREKALVVLIQVLRFISLITRSPFASKFSLLDGNMFRIIGDKAADFNYYLLHDYFKYMKPQPSSRLKYFIQKHLYQCCQMKGILDSIINLKITLEPESIFLIVWNVILLIHINLNTLYITVRFSFDFENYPPERFQICEVFLFKVPFYLYLFDILIKMNTCYYELGYLVRDRNKIMANFYKHHFLMNLLIIVPSLIYLIGVTELPLYLFLVIKGFSIPEIMESIIDRMELTTNYWVIYDLLRLIYVILYQSHLCCCGLYYVGLLDKETSWLLTNNLINETWIIKYFSTYYWSIITMTTIGYGDVTPQNLMEKVYLIFVAIVSCCTFGYSINSIGQILGQLQSKNHQIRVDLNDLKQFLRVRGYNHKLQIKILRFFEFLWKDQSNENKLDLNKFNQQLPSHLYNEMMIDLNMKSISKIPFFKENFNEDFISALASKFVEEKLVPFNTIFQKNDPSNFLYILCDGEIEYFVEIPEGSANILGIQIVSGQDQIFGQQEFLLDQNYEIGCRSLTSSRILKISKNDFQTIAKKYGYEKYCQLKDLVKFSGRFDEFHLHCVGCNKSTHMLYQCPMLTGFPNKTKIIIQYRKNKIQERNYYCRQNANRRLSSLIFEAQISDTVLYYLMQDPKLSQQISSKYFIQSLKQQQHQKEQNKETQKDPNLQYDTNYTNRKLSVLNIKGRKQSQYIKRLPGFLNNSLLNFKNTQEDKLKAALESFSKNVSGCNSEQQTPQLKELKKFKTHLDKNQDEINPLEHNKITQDIGKSLLFKSINQSTNQCQSNEPDTISEMENSSDSEISESSSSELKEISPAINYLNQQHMGTYKDIYEEFDKCQDFQNYMSHMNSHKILEQLNQNKDCQNFTDFMIVNFVRKRRSKRAKLIIKIDD